MEKYSISLAIQEVEAECISNAALLCQTHRISKILEDFWVKLTE